MKKLLASLLLCMVILSSHAQSFKFGTIAADAGFGFGMYGIKAHSPVNNSDVTGIAFVGSLPTVNAEFGLLKFLGVGLHYRRGTYGKGGGGKGRGNDLGLRLNFHLANKNDKFDLPIGVGVGTTNLFLPLSTTQTFGGRGTLINIHVSPHFYFGKYVGMFLSVGYNKHVLTHIEAHTDGDLYTENDGATWRMGGVYFEMGVAGKFACSRKKNKKQKASR